MNKIYDKVLKKQKKILSLIISVDRVDVISMKLFLSAFR